jgi:hypothetical protein
MLLTFRCRIRYRRPLVITEQMLRVPGDELGAIGFTDLSEGGRG